MNITITFMWIPAHREIKGNKTVLAKWALKHQEIMDVSLSKSETKEIIKRKIIEEWQHSWNTTKTA